MLSMKLSIIVSFLGLVKISPHEKFENGRFAKISIREIFGKGCDSRKLVLVKCDFFDLAKINSLR